MSRGRRYIWFEGIYEKDVLGIFTIIRGFANLQDLAKVSVPYQMVDSVIPGIVDGHQREVDSKHAQDIKDYLEKSDTKFFPEIILSVRTMVSPDYWGEQEQIGILSTGEDGIKIARRFTSRNVRIQEVRIDLDRLAEIKEKRLIRRIDGNHRLCLANTLTVDAHSPKKYFAPFCMIILKPPNQTSEDFAESKIFHTINSKALILESEHALKLLLGQNPEYAPTAQQEFDNDPTLHLTRLLRDKIDGLSEIHKERLGGRPLTSLNEIAKALLLINTDIKNNKTLMEQYADNLFAAITEFLTRLWHSFPQLCRAEYFIELAASVWAKYVDVHDNTERINKSVEYLENLGDWIGEEGFVSIEGKKSLALQLLQVYESVKNKIPKKVFLARWYPHEIHDADDKRKSVLRLAQIRQTLNKIRTDHNISLELIDLGTERGGTGPIHQRMYEAIESSDIILIDLTGQRPNVYTEAGYALKHHEKGKLLFLFNPKNESDKVPFDLGTYRHEEISEAAEIPDKLLPHLVAILKNSGANI